MSKNFDDLFSKLKEIETKKVAVAVAQDEPVLEAIKEANERGIAKAVLVGDKVKIQEIADKINMDLKDFEIMDVKDPKKATLEAVKLVLNKEVGLRTGKVMSHVSVFEIEGWDRLFFLTDVAFNTYPELKDKVAIINNAVSVAHACGLPNPKVGVVCPVEVVNPNMPSTIDAALLAKMSDRGQFKGCVVDGPFALDNAISLEAAHHKGVKGEVAGQADILMLPNIETGNVMYKTLTYFAPTKNGCLLVGTSAPAILTSRADTFETKVNSIALAALVAAKNK